MNDAWWTTTLCVPDEPAPRLAIMEKFPGLLSLIAMANDLPTSLRTTWPSRKTYSKRPEEHPNAPAWHVFDATFRRTSWWAANDQGLKPDSQIPKKWFDEGFVAKANTIRELG